MLSPSLSASISTISLWSVMLRRFLLNVRGTENRQSCALLTSNVLFSASIDVTAAYPSLSVTVY